MGPLCHIYSCAAPLQHPAFIRSTALCSDILLFYWSQQTASAALPERFVAKRRAIKDPISAMTNKPNNKYGKKKAIMLPVINGILCRGVS